MYLCIRIVRTSLQAFKVSSLELPDVGNETMEKNMVTAVSLWVSLVTSRRQKEAKEADGATIEKDDLLGSLLSFPANGRGA